jgi:hypothetical protein
VARLAWPDARAVETVPVALQIENILKSVIFNYYLYLIVLSLHFLPKQLQVE